jgi:hypothetical protein
MTDEKTLSASELSDFNVTANALHADYFLNQKKVFSRLLNSLAPR